MKGKLVPIAFLIILSIPAIYSLLHSGFFQSDDGEWMVIRFSAFYQALREGQFPVRFLTRLNFGYGYPVANFLYPGFMYLGVPIHILGFGFVDTIKIIMGASMIGSALFCFAWLSKLFNKWPSFVGSLVYLYAPYHLYDLYKRGSIGEVLAFAIVPFILWQIERRSLLWTSLGIGFLLLAHNTLAVLFAGLIVLYMILVIYASKNKREIIVQCGTSLLLGFGIAAFFWIPALLDLQFTAFSATQISQWQEYFADNALVGISTYGILLATFILFVVGYIHMAKHRLTVLFFIVALMSLLLSVPLSTVLWNSFPVAFIQFPFRFLSLTIIAISFLAATTVSVLPKKHSFVLGTVFLLVTFFSSVPFLKPQEFFDKGEGFYATNQGSTTVKNEYKYIFAQKNPQEGYKEKIELMKGDGTIQDTVIASGQIGFRIDSRENTEIQVNTSYFPGWEVFINNKKKTLRVNAENFGEIQLDVPKGVSDVEIKFAETKMRKISNIISLVSLGILFFVVIRNKKFL